MCVCHPVCVCVCVCAEFQLAYLLVIASHLQHRSTLYRTFSRYIMEQVVQRKLSLAEKGVDNLDRGIHTSIVSAVKM